MKTSSLLLYSSIMALSLPAAAVAQDQAPQTAGQAGDGEEIVVTAQFRAQNLQDTPIAITAVNSAMLESRSQTDISQVANQAPSVTLKPQGAAFGPSLGANIRGVGQFDFNPALEPGVGQPTASAGVEPTASVTVPSTVPVGRSAMSTVSTVPSPSNVSDRVAFR